MRAALAAEVARLFKAHNGTYGSPRLTADLRDAGWQVSVNTVAAVMRELGLAARRRKLRWSLTRQGKGRWRAPDLVGRDFTAEAVNQKWFGDGTEIITDEGKLHLASVLDIGSRRILGFALSEHHDAELAYGALAMAVAVRGGNVAGVIFHTDQGSEYTAGAVRAACGRLGIRQSMGRPGSALDKACVSHCTSWRGLGWNSVSDRASLPGDEAGVAGCGCLEHSLVLVVGLVRDEQPGAVPVLDRGSVHSERFGDLGHVEQAAGMQPLGVAGHVVGAA
jgi:hypothetical protein